MGGYSMFLEYNGRQVSIEEFQKLKAIEKAEGKSLDKIGDEIIEKIEKEEVVQTPTKEDEPVLEEKVEQEEPIKVEEKVVVSKPRTTKKTNAKKWK